MNTGIRRFCKNVLRCLIIRQTSWFYFVLCEYILWSFTINTLMSNSIICMRLHAILRTHARASINTSANMLVAAPFRLRSREFTGIHGRVRVFLYAIVHIHCLFLPRSPPWFSLALSAVPPSYDRSDLQDRTYIIVKKFASKSLTFILLYRIKIIHFYQIKVN